MNKTRKVIVFTGSRGEWGYLRPVLEKFKMNNINFDIIVTNMHLEDLHGSTKREILADGFCISDEISMNISGNHITNWTKSLGLLLFQLPDIINRMKPDLALVAGDRAESFIFTVACFYMNLPSAHIQAGELSGHKDGMARHAIGKLTNIHFASNQDAYDRLLRFGEAEFRTFLTGAPQLDDILSTNYSKEDLEMIKARLRMDSKPYVINIFHPSSDDDGISGYVEAIHSYFRSLEINQLWILPNSDGGGAELVNQILNLEKSNVFISSNLSRRDFLTLLKYCEVLVGNSSAGILEAPALGTPSINIGKRQEGRLNAQSVTTLNAFSISEFDQVFKDLRTMPRENYSLYGDGNSADRIVDIIKNVDLSFDLLNKYVL